MKRVITTTRRAFEYGQGGLAHKLDDLLGIGIDPHAHKIDDVRELRPLLRGCSEPLPFLVIPSLLSLLPSPRLVFLLVRRNPPFFLFVLLIEHHPLVSPRPTFLLP